MGEMYYGKAFSPPALITDNISASDTIIKVSDTSAFPDAPNYATIGTDEDGETIFYAAKTSTALSGCKRGIEGTPKAWSKGEVIARNFTAADQADMIRSIEEAAKTAEASGVKFSDGQTFQGLYDADRLTGPPGAAAGFGVVTATVDANVGTPSVKVIASGPDTAKKIEFVFENLKGEPGDNMSIDDVPITIPVEGWQPVAGKYRYQLDLPCGEARVDNTPAVTLDEDSEDIAAIAGLSPSADTFDGILRLKAMEVPSAPMTATVTLIYIGNGSGPDGGGGTYVLPVAGPDTLGGIKVGDGLSVAPDGTLSVNAETVMTDDDLVNEDEAKESVTQILIGD